MNKAEVLSNTHNQKDNYLISLFYVCSAEKKGLIDVCFDFKYFWETFFVDKRYLISSSKLF